MSVSPADQLVRDLGLHRPPPGGAGGIAVDPAARWERVAFMFCKMGTTGLIAWAVTPAVFVLAVSAAAVVLYARAVTLGLTRSRCFLRRPALIMAFWTTVFVADAVWLIVLGQRLPG
jgi:hypothetical protein